MLKFHNVSLSIGGVEILRDLNFEVTPGEVVAILGVSGAGKTSIFRLLISELRPTLGSIKLDGFTLEELSLQSIQKYRRQVGVVFQDCRLLQKKTVFENIAFALEVCGEEKKIAQIVSELLELVGLEHKHNAFPAQLSGGEAQRVAIARALVHNPKILLADEATGTLDSKNSRGIAKLFQRLNKERGLTILFSTHDLVLVRELRPRVIRIEKGHILFDEKECSLETAFTGIL